MATTIKVMYQDGVVLGVFSNDPTVQVEICDLDTDEGNADAFDREYDEATDTMHTVTPYITHYTDDQK